MPSNFINRDKVVAMLIKERCKLADKRARANQKNEFVSRVDLPKSNCLPDKQSIYQLFPPRNRWCSLGKNREYKDSVKRNELRLKYTYLKARRSHCKEEWYIGLCNYADGIVRSALYPPKSINSPIVFAIEKERHTREKTIVFRPICSFPYGLKIIFSLLNRFLTKAFDDAFYDCSYAFRTCNGKHKLQHLNAVSAIQDYRKAHCGIPLYVAECDMKKFYDTIDHRVIKQRFCFLLQWAKKNNHISSADAKLVKRWFFLYVDCFDFKKHVYVNNKKPNGNSFWRVNAGKDWTYRIEWVQKLATAHLKGKMKKRNCVGVPQGGSLSGLIANIIMHDVDKAVYRAKGYSDILYCRFCDDMILVGTDKINVSKVFNTYQEAIENSKLYAHDASMMKLNKMKDFWEGKSKEPYEWNEKGEQIYPWITFVGFDINWRGNLRIRKKSFKKELAKQHKVAYELLSPYMKGKSPRYCADTILSSLTNRLICMSVGRVKLWNYRDFNHTCCWMNAFSILDQNPWSVAQLKQLDSHRNVVIKRTSEALKTINCPAIKKASSPDDEANSRFLYKGSPYSYYGQCFIYKYKIGGLTPND